MNQWIYLVTPERDAYARVDSEQAAVAFEFVGYVRCSRAQYAEVRQQVDMRDARVAHIGNVKRLLED